MENKEIKNTYPYTHDCDECFLCQESLQEMKGIPVLHATLHFLKSFTATFQARFSNIKEIARGGFGIISKATYMDGLIDTNAIKHHGSLEYERWEGDEEGTEVALKIITNSEEIFKELNIQRTIEVQNGIARDIAKGLSKIHSSGLVHCDLHSGNILKYSSKGRKTVNIGDLGLCQPINNEATTTSEKEIFGVILYIPPEVLRGEKFTPAGDITGIRPEITSPLIPLCIVEIIVKCWDANPLNRPTAEEVQNKLWKLWKMYKLFKVSTNDVSIIKEFADEEFTYEEGKTVYRQCLESENHIKEMLKNDATTNYSATTTTTTTEIHSGAYYTSRLLTARIDDFFNG
ncbi:hypothetical protein G9A89_007276 [Geosiphon pyriformis]|nr:hypothetical protein G9A89_007276 [Geosiphon pyriformis]